MRLKEDEQDAIKKTIRRFEKTIRRFERKITKTKKRQRPQRLERELLDIYTCTEKCHLCQVFRGVSGSCRRCPIFKTEGDYCDTQEKHRGFKGPYLDSNEVGYLGILSRADDSFNPDAEAFLLALMVYLWGFIDE